MRTIKFRGKRTDTKKWVYGLPGYNFGLVVSRINGVKVNSDLVASNFHHEVIPETVGEFTGLTDKNGKEIYEGDICRVGGLGGFTYPVDYTDGMFRLGKSIPLFWDCRKSEVIGNVYEHNNLLNE